MEIREFDKHVLSSYRYTQNVPHHGLRHRGLPALTAIRPNSIARYVLLTVRDPLCDYDTDPTSIIAERLTDVTVAGRTQMFLTITGKYEGVPVTVISGGSGGPEAELAMMDLLEHSQADTFIRVGGSGGMHWSVTPGDIVISTGIVRDEGLTQAYVPPTYPAICDRNVVNALEKAASRAGIRYHCGITRSTDSDFVQSGRPAAGGFLPIHQLQTVDSWARAGVLNGDRESAAIVVLGNLYGKRTGAVCSVADNIVTGEKFEAGKGHHHAIELALRGITILNEYDNAYRKKLQRSTTCGKG